MAAKRPRGVGPVVARSATRRRPTRDPSSRDLNRCRAISVVVARSQPLSHDLRRRRTSSTRRRPTLYPSSGVAYPSLPVSFFNSRTRRRALRTRRWAVRTRRRALTTRRRTGRTRHRDPSRARPAPVRARPISTRAFHYSPALCQSIPACTCHSDCLRDSLKGASYFSSHVIHHDYNLGNTLQ